MGQDEDRNGEPRRAATPQDYDDVTLSSARQRIWMASLDDLNNHAPPIDLNRLGSDMYRLLIRSGAELAARGLLPKANVERSLARALVATMDLGGPAGVVLPKPTVVAKAEVGGAEVVDLPTAAKKTWLAGLSPVQLVYVVSIFLFALGLPLGIIYTPVKVQLVVNGDMVTVPLAVAITLHIIRRSKG